MSENTRRNPGSGNHQRPGRRGNQRSAAPLEQEVASELSATVRRGLDGVPLHEETEPAFIELFNTGVDRVLAEPERRVEAVDNMGTFTGDLATETRRRSLASVTLAVFRQIKDTSCPMWPFC